MRVKRLITAVVIIAAALIVSWAYSEPTPAVPKADRKNGERVHSRNALVGNAYEVLEAIDVHVAPFSGNIREVAPGRLVTVVGLADGRNAGYALSRGVVSGGNASRVNYAKADLLTRENHSRPEKARLSPYRAKLSGMSATVSRLFAGDTEAEDFPVLIAVTIGLFVLLWALWHSMGFTKTVSFVLLVLLVCSLLALPPGWLSLAPLSGLVILLAALLGVTMFLRLTVILLGFAAIGYVSYRVYLQGASITVVVLASAILAAVIFSLILLRKGHDTKEGIDQRSTDDSGHQVHLRGQG